MQYACTLSAKREVISPLIVKVFGLCVRTNILAGSRKVTRQHNGFHPERARTDHPWFPEDSPRDNPVSPCCCSSFPRKSAPELLGYPMDTDNLPMIHVTLTRPGVYDRWGESASHHTFSGQMRIASRRGPVRPKGNTDCPRDRRVSTLVKPTTGAV